MFRNSGTFKNGLSNSGKDMGNGGASTYKRRALDGIRSKVIIINDERAVSAKIANILPPFGWKRM